MGVIIHPSVRFHRYEQDLSLGITPLMATTIYRSSIGGGQPLSSPKRRSLGRPLPYQLADTTQAAPEAANIAIAFTLAGLSGITPPFGGLCPTSGDVPTRYYLVCHSRSRRTEIRNRTDYFQCCFRRINCLPTIRYSSTSCLPVAELISPMLIASFIWLTNSSHEPIALLM
jgi:hypothetical protein